MALLDKNLLGGHGHPLFGLVRECLSNIPERRPTTANLLSSLEAVGREMEGGMLLHDIAQVKNTRAFKAKDKIIETLQASIIIPSGHWFGMYSRLSLIWHPWDSAVWSQ